MSGMLVIMLLCLYNAIYRGTDSRTKRYYITNRERTFGKDLCDFLATVETIRANLKTGTIHGSYDEVYNIKDYLLPIKFTDYFRTYEVYSTSSGIGRAVPIFRAKWDPIQYAKFVKDEFMNEGVTPIFKNLYPKDMASFKSGKDFEYQPEIMSPDKMLRFYKDLQIKDEKLNHLTLVAPVSLSDFDTVAYDRDVMLSFGGSISIEWSYLSGCDLQCWLGEGKSDYFVRVPSPTEEELITCLCEALF